MCAWHPLATASRRERWTQGWGGWRPQAASAHPTSQAQARPATVEQITLWMPRAANDTVQHWTLPRQRPRVTQQMGQRDCQATQLDGSSPPTSAWAPTPQPKPHTQRRPHHARIPTAACAAVSNGETTTTLPRQHHARRQGHERGVHRAQPGCQSPPTTRRWTRRITPRMHWHSPLFATNALCRRWRGMAARHTQTQATAQLLATATQTT